MQVKWTYEGKQEIEKKIKEVYGTESDFILDYAFRYNKEEFKDLSYLEVFEKCKGDVYVSISYYIFNDGNFDKYEDAEKAYKILRPYLLDNKISRYDFNVIFYKRISNKSLYPMEIVRQRSLMINYMKMEFL